MPITSDNKLIFHETPEVEFAGNTFIDVPIILQYDDKPLITVANHEKADFITQFEIYNKDGVYIAKVKGTQIYLTDEGKRVNIKMKHPNKMTICELDNQTLFEIHRKGPASLKLEAELYTPDGRFMKKDSNGIPSSLLNNNGDIIKLGKTIAINCKFVRCDIGLHITSNGKRAAGINYKKIKPLNQP